VKNTKNTINTTQKWILEDKRWYRPPFPLDKLGFNKS
jgi:hypothetical protein